MKIELITKQNKRTIVDVPFIPRVGDDIAVSNMADLYTEGFGESPVWTVTRVQWHYEEVTDSMGDSYNRCYGCCVWVKNEEDD